MRRSRILMLVCAGSLSLVSTSCSLFVGSMQPVSITATDPQAEILFDGVLVGKGMVTVDLARSRTHGVQARVGDRAGTAYIGREVSTTGVLDIIGGILFLVPFLGILGPGFMELEPATVTIAVPPPVPPQPSVEQGQ